MIINLICYSFDLQASQTQKTSKSSNGVGKVSVKKRTTERPSEKVGQSRSLGTLAAKVQPTLNKKSYNTSALGKSRSVGTVTKAKTTGRQNGQGGPNRSLTLNTMAKSATGTATMSKKSSPPIAGRTGNVPKKLMPLKTDSKPRRAEQAFTSVAKAEPPKRELQAKGRSKLPAVALKKTSKIRGNLTSHRSQTATDQGRKEFSSQNVSKDKKTSSNTSKKLQVSTDYLSIFPCSMAY